MKKPGIERLGHYEIIEEIGRGGMAVVYKGIQSSLNRTVAIKVLPATFARDKEFIARFDREAETIAHLSHPNIIQIIDRGREENTCYFVMEYVDGLDLDDFLKSQTLTFRQILEIAIQVSRALAYAHSKGIVHRDLKPSNILIAKDSGTVKVADFGLVQLAQSAGELSTLTQSNIAMGTLEYMAPEQRRDARNVDCRADIFAFGIILYEMFTGQIPVGHFKRPGEINQEIPRALDEIILKCLKPSPDERFQTAGALSQALGAILSEESGVMDKIVHTVKTARDRATTAMRNRPRRFAFGAAAAVIAAAAFLCMRGRGQGPDPGPAPDAAPPPASSPAAQEIPNPPSIGTATAAPTEPPQPTITPPPTGTATAAPTATPQPVATRAFAKQVPEEPKKAPAEPRLVPAEPPKQAPGGQKAPAKPAGGPAPDVSDRPVPLAGAEADFAKAESYAAANMKTPDLRRYAVTSMRSVVENYKTKDPRWAEKAQMRIGQIYETAGETTLALSEYTRLLALFPQGVLRADAQYRIAECLKPCGLFSGLDFSLKEKRGKSIDAYGRVYRDYPASPHAPKALFQMGLLQEEGNTTADYEAAIVSFENLARDYPKSEEAPHAMLRVAELCKTRKVKQYDKTIRTYEAILARYPEHEEEFHILLNIAAVKGGLLNDSTEAIEGYRRVIREKPGTKDALEANRRIEALLQAARPPQ